MNIGFFIKWNINSLNSSGNVLGDELLATSFVKLLTRKYQDIKAAVYGLNFLPTEKLDVMIYLNDTPPKQELAKHHILYFQNAFQESIDTLHKRLMSYNYDGYIFFSRKLLKIHKDKGGNGVYIPFGVDTSHFYPREIEKKYEFDVCYVGNDIKGNERTMKFLYPARNFNFGLFGNWKMPKYRFYHRDYWKKQPPYKKLFEKISKGKIPQEDVPILYSSASINLNCTIQECVDWDVITLRTYEVLACKGFLISDEVPSAVNELKECMVFTKGNEDLSDKISYYLSNEKERKQLTQNGFEYVQKNASAEVRAVEIYNYIEEVIS
ncbi:MAG: glycosyltransferase [Candidatus Riflebacteria bacterium]|nr:glycosyltransferase [Candidatus Riflebacteria bacterium]